MPRRLLGALPARRPPRPGPGGVGDGLPALPSGEPLLQRWFVIAFLVLVPVVLGVTVLAFTSTSRPELDAAARRPPGDAEVTHERGDAALNTTRTAEAGPGCAARVSVVGDEVARAAGRRALEGTCGLLERGLFPDALAGLDRWGRGRGILRVAAFELTGVDSSARVEDGRLVIELNAKFQAEDATRAAPAVVHELVHLANGMPGEAVTAEAELAALKAQDAACRRLDLGPRPPRGCRDAAEVLAGPDPLARLVAAGYPRRAVR